MGRHFSQAAEFLNARRYDLAERLLRLDLEADPEDAPALALLALCLSDRQQLAAAHRAAADATRLAPELVLAHYARAVVHAAEGDRGLERAGEALRVAIQLDPTHTASLSLIATVRLNQGFPDLALPWCDRCLQLDPQHAGALSVRAMILAELGRHDESRQNMGAALASDPAGASTHRMAGQARRNVGDFTAAEVHLAEAVRLDPSNLLCSNELRLIRTWLGAGRALLRVAVGLCLLRPPHGSGRSARPNWFLGGLLLLGVAQSACWISGLPGQFPRNLAALAGLLMVSLATRFAPDRWAILLTTLIGALAFGLLRIAVESAIGGLDMSIPPQTADPVAARLGRLLIVPLALGADLFFLAVVCPKLGDLVTGSGAGGTPATAVAGLGES